MQSTLYVTIRDSDVTAATSPNVLQDNLLQLAAEQQFQLSADRALYRSSNTDVVHC